ncbi:hypothetical protein M0804_014803 [Polistes exclamans]|nr:hypothetical protein M0804_014806 [Polistes exclamans]KAI4474532.1 hypothetical protein M0804_014803 [Polistes exclamans]
MDDSWVRVIELSRIKSNHTKDRFSLMVGLVLAKNKQASKQASKLFNYDDDDDDDDDNGGSSNIRRRRKSVTQGSYVDDDEKEEEEKEVKEVEEEDV